MGGAEVILQAFRQLYPQADWYTGVYNPHRAPFAKNWNVKSSFISHLPWLRDHHEWYPYLMPFIFESFDFTSYDLVVSIGSAECKGIITKPSTTHIHYNLTPTRYLYSHADEYLRTGLMCKIASWLRAWDLIAATRPDKMIAISEHVKKRIQKYYKRNSQVIYPPVDTSNFKQSDSLINRYTDLPYYLTVSRLVPYKRIDLLIEAFNHCGKPLVIVGTGSESNRLRKLAKSNITFTGFVEGSKLKDYYLSAKAFIQVNEEDFGIAMCEAQAAGVPVIAYNVGGAAEIVKDGKTGILFSDQTSESINQAINKFEKTKIAPADCVKNASHFDKVIWSVKMQKEINLWQQTLKS